MFLREPYQPDIDQPDTSDFPSGHLSKIQEPDQFLVEIPLCEEINGVVPETAPLGLVKIEAGVNETSN